MHVLSLVTSYVKPIIARCYHRYHVKAWLSR